MDKITGHFDVSCASKLKFLDAMDQVIMADTETFYVETMAIEEELPVIKPQAIKKNNTKTFYVETVPLKECRVCITKLDKILFGDPDAKSSKTHDDGPLFKKTPHTFQHSNQTRKDNQNSTQCQ